MYVGIAISNKADIPPKFTMTSRASIAGNDCWLLVCYSDVMMSTMASQITGVTIVYSIVFSCMDQRKHQSSTSLAPVSGIHRCQVNSLHKGPVSRKCFHLMTSLWCLLHINCSGYFLYIAADAPAPCVARSSLAMVVTMNCKRVLVL